MTGTGRGSTTVRTRFTMSAASRMPLSGAGTGSYRSHAKAAGARMTAAVSAVPITNVLSMVFLIVSPVFEKFGFSVFTDCRSVLIT